jgi:hypothetical protein
MRSQQNHRFRSARAHILWLALALGGLLLATTATCTDDQDLCKAFCQQAAECLECGGTTANLDRCYDVCSNDLTIEEKKGLSSCTQDCANMRSCPAFTAHPDLNPCR